MTGDYANADWGVYNVISNGGNVPNQWRTLSFSEWCYVFLYRSTSSNIRYASAKVNGINGLILLPDSWSESIYSLNYTNNHNAPYTTNEISLSDWEILGANGAVFLPASGYRMGTTVANPGLDVYYWSTSSQHSYNGYHAMALVFPTDYFLDYRISFERNYGHSVRMVRDVIE